ncbi:MAG: winged helix-turn-helix transcriptional regulator, partial [Nanoarchaeota archaeon]
RLRFTQIKEATKINHATLHKTLRRLGKKGIIRKILLDVTKPRAEKNIVHYELTKKGKIIVSIVITRGIKSLYQNKYDVIKIKKLMI